MMWLVTSMVGLVPRVKLATPRRNVAATARHFTDSLFDNWWGGLCEFKGAPHFCPGDHVADTEPGPEQVADGDEAANEQAAPVWGGGEGGEELPEPIQVDEGRYPGDDWGQVAGWYEQATEEQHGGAEGVGEVEGVATVDEQPGDEDAGAHAEDGDEDNAGRQQERVCGVEGDAEDKAE